MNIKRTHLTSTGADVVIDLRARRRCQLEARGLDPVAVAVNLLVETGSVPGWDISGYDGDDGAGWAA
ncbi:hypothetical protein AB0B25_05395 [Nocardia sp. NPDC049190]|uniref:hypothetical protein n=1 Tax=Nocardia sp. NPDC049190 TaxID=3155650 RepID=UPI0033E6CD3C